LYSALTTMTINSEFVNLADEVDAKADEGKKISKKTKSHINEIRRIIGDLNRKDTKGRPTQTIIEQECRKQEKMSNNLVAGLLREFNGIEWTYKLKNSKFDGTRVKYYKLLKEGKRKKE